MACETTYPVGQGITNLVLTLVNNIGGGIFLLIQMVPNIGKYNLTVLILPQNQAFAGTQVHPGFFAGVDPGVQVRGVAHLKKNPVERREAPTIFGVFRV